MNESMRSPEGKAVWRKATDISQFLKDNLDRLDPMDVEAIYEQIGIKGDSDESELLENAMDPEGYLSMSDEQRVKVDDMYQSLKSAIEGEDS